jgi:ABC-type dipeptide/oligopeptide/nickel transport system permease subunit
LPVFSGADGHLHHADLMDVVLAFPSLLLALVLVAILGPSLINAMIAIAIVQQPHYVRLDQGCGDHRDE